MEPDKLDHLQKKIVGLLVELQSYNSEALQKLFSESSQIKFQSDYERLSWLINRSVEMLSQRQLVDEEWLLGWNATEQECQQQQQQIFRLMRSFNEEEFEQMKLTVQMLKQQEQHALQNLPIITIQDQIFKHIANQPEPLRQRLKRIFSIYAMMRYSQYRKSDSVQSQEKEEENSETCLADYYNLLLSMRNKAKKSVTNKSAENVIGIDETALLQVLCESNPSLIKLIAIYELCIITKQELLDLIPRNSISQEHLLCLQSILSTRESSRLRGINLFKPSIDQDTELSHRFTPSYIINPNPSCPPHRHNPVLNRSLISVSPHNHRSLLNPHNPIEKICYNMEDQIHAVHTCRLQLLKTAQLLSQISECTSESQANSIFHKVIQMGVLQTVYNKANSEQRQFIEGIMETSKREIADIFAGRIRKQEIVFTEAVKLQEKTWLGQANMYWKYVPNIKGFRMPEKEVQAVQKGYLGELMQMIGKSKQCEPGVIRFQSINSFEGILPDQRCLSHSITSIEISRQQWQPTILPAYLMCMNNSETQQILYSSVLAYLQQKHQQKSIGLFKQLTINILNWKQFETLPEVNQQRSQAHEESEITIESQMLSLSLNVTNFLVSQVSIQILHLTRLLFTIYQRILRTCELLHPGGSTALYNILKECPSRPSLGYYIKIHDLFGYLATQNHSKLSYIAFGIRKLIKVFCAALSKTDQVRVEGEVRLVVKKSDQVVMVGLVRQQQCTDIESYSY